MNETPQGLTNALESVLPDPIDPYAGLVAGVIVALVIFIVGWMIAKWASAITLRGLRRGKVDEALARFLSSVAQYTVLAAVAIAALGAVGVQTTSLVAIFGAAGLAVGLALQGSLSNFASGVMILLFKPFVLDDKITAGGHTGLATDIGLFATTLMLPTNEKIIIPNSGITGGSIVNHTTVGTLRGTVEVGVAYGANVGQVIDVLGAAARKADLVLADPAPAVAFTDMAASSINFSVHGWCKAADYTAMLHNLRRAIYEELNAAGIEIPYDQVVIHNAG
jgi:small conductance mechanosensitive channel